MLNLLLIEDDIDLANTVVEYLELESIQCDHASNGAAGLQIMAQENYDVLLLDLNLPRIDGLSVCQTLREHGDDTPVLMLTARDQLQDKIDGFAVGTDDYLVKPFELAELVIRVKALAKRRSGQVRVLRYSDLEMNLNEKVVRRSNTIIKLSPTAWKILQHLLAIASAVASKSDLERVVWGDEPPDSNALKVHIHHLRKLVDGPYPTALIQTIPGHGFSLESRDKIS